MASGILAVFGLMLAFFQFFPGTWATGGGRPNIVFLLSDDQDRRLGSMDFMPTLQKEMVQKGASFINHHATTAQCCPSRVSLLRGQAAHNTNITNVFAPGGNYEKFVLSGQDKDYLPHWLKKAGYRTEYLGKFLNGVNILNYDSPPKGWDHIEYFMEPYQTTPNRVVMSENGNHPVAYLGYHQTDVIRAKAIARLEMLTAGEEPFFFFISPTAPHVDDETATTVPCTRHDDLFPNATAPRSSSFNPPDDIQRNKVSWIGELPRLSAMNETWSDLEYRRRAQALMGNDELLSDVLNLLEDRGALENTFIVYTSDNGYHLGQHRMGTGKTTPYAEDTNLPFVVRGPGVPAGVESRLPQLHLDLAPTFLEIAGLEKDSQPSFLDGRSLLGQWTDPEMTYPGQDQGANKEILNIEYWGSGSNGIPGTVQYRQNTYKSLRIVGDTFAYLYIHWCGINAVELYDTNNDPYEITNLALGDNLDEHTARLLTRLNALLLVTKSCGEDSCRNVWQTLLPGLLSAAASSTASDDTPPAAARNNITTLSEALDPSLDALFAQVPPVRVESCLGYQDAANELPFWPPPYDGVPSPGLGEEHRADAVGLGPSYKFAPMLGNERPEGGLEQRHATLPEIEARSRKLTREELDPLQARIIRSSGSR